MTANKEYCRDYRCEGKIWLTNVKYLWLPINTSWALVFCFDTHIFTIPQIICINNEKVVSLPNKEYVSGHK